MLLFESLSVGTMVVLVVMVGMMVAVGIYATVVWPLTQWDLAELDKAEYASWAKTVLWSLFGGGSLAGYLCVSGVAFRQKPSKRPPTGASRNVTGT